MKDRPMRDSIYSLLIVSIITCCVTKKTANPNENDAEEIISVEVEQVDKIERQIEELAFNFKDFEHRTLSDTIYADLDGDGNIEKAFFMSHQGKQGILIVDSQSIDSVKIGFGKAFEEMDNFGWVDYWGLVRDSVTHEVVINDGEIVGDTTVVLDNPSIVLRKMEVGGGIITFQNERYLWIHQAE